MKIISTQSTQRASTLTDVLIVIATIALLAGVYLANKSRPKAASKRLNCLSNLRSFGLGLRIWSNDNNDKFPWAVPASKGGTLEYAATAQVFRHFLATSNELSTPKILVCNADGAAAKTPDWNLFNNSNLSYLVGLTSEESDPQSILAGDRNLTTNGVVLGSGVFQLKPTSVMGWTKEIHKSVGNVVLADGSAQGFSTAALQNQWLAATNTVRRLAVP